MIQPANSYQSAKCPTRDCDIPSSTGAPAAPVAWRKGHRRTWQIEQQHLHYSEGAASAINRAHLFPRLRAGWLQAALAGLAACGACTCWAPEPCSSHCSSCSIHGCRLQLGPLAHWKKQGSAQDCSEQTQSHHPVWYDHQDRTWEALMEQFRLWHAGVTNASINRQTVVQKAARLPSADWLFLLKLTYNLNMVLETRNSRLWFTEQCL